MSSAMTPQPGDLLVLDGVPRRILFKNGSTVTFGHPDPDEEAARRATVAAWKAAGRPYPPPPASREGAISERWLYWLDALKCWAVQGLVDRPQEDPNAIVLGVAEVTTHGQ